MNLLPISNASGMPLLAGVTAQDASACSHCTFIKRRKKRKVKCLAATYEPCQTEQQDLSLWLIPRTDLIEAFIRGVGR